MTTGYAADEAAACALGDKLMQYGVIRHVTGEHWMREQELYSLTGYTSPPMQLEPFKNFLMSHVSVAELLLLVPPSLQKQLHEAIQNEAKVHYAAEDYSFAFPVSSTASHR